MHYQTDYKGDARVNAIQIPTHVKRSLYNIPLDMPSFCSYKFTIALKSLKYTTLFIELTEIT